MGRWSSARHMLTPLCGESMEPGSGGRQPPLRRWVKELFLLLATCLVLGTAPVMSFVLSGIVFGDSVVVFSCACFLAAAASFFWATRRSRSFFFCCCCLFFAIGEFSGIVVERMVGVGPAARQSTTILPGQRVGSRTAIKEADEIRRLLCLSRCLCAQMSRTFSARGPFGPRPSSNDTRCPSWS